MSCRLYEGRRIPSTPNLYRYWGGTHHLPQGVFDDESRDTDYEYLYLGKAAEGFYMRRDDFENRLTDTVLQSDFDKMEAGRTDFFHVWNSRGTQLAAPRTFMVDALGMDLGKWSYLQKRNWEKVKESVAKATLPKPYDPVMGRFIQLPKNIPLSNFIFSTVEGEPHVTLQELKSYVAKLTGPRPHVMSWDEASNDGSLYRIGSSFLGFYDTWVDSSTYMRLCGHFSAIPQERKWPDQAKAMEINDLLTNAGEQPNERQTTTTVTVRKLTNASNSPNRGISQQAVMNRVSATTVRLLPGFSWCIPADPVLQGCGKHVGGSR